VKKSLDCVRLLLPYSDINAQDLEGNTALMYACSEPKNVACVQFLLKNHADPAVLSEQSFTALMEACRVDRSELIKFLLDAIAHFNSIWHSLNLGPFFWLAKKWRLLLVNMTRVGAIMLFFLLYEGGG